MILKKTPSPGYRVALLARAPIPGQVKTRLVPALGEKGACLLHQRLLTHCLNQLQKLPLDLWVTARHSWFETNVTDCASLLVQPKGDLGERMAAIAEHYLLQGISPVLIGSDCPFLDASIIARVINDLESHDVVINPADDGGYVLLAMSATSPDPHDFMKLFSGIDWGTDSVLQQTLEKAASSGVSVSCLPKLADIDVKQDLDRIRETALLDGLEWP